MGERDKYPQSRSIGEWLQDLKEFQTDYVWLGENYPDIFEAIREGMQRPHSALDAIEGLNLIFQYAMTRSEYKELQPLLYEGLLHAQFLDDHEAQTQIWTRLGHNHLLLGLLREAKSAFESAFYHDTAQNSADNLLLTYIGRIKTDALQYRIDENIVWKSFDLAGKVHTPNLLPTLYSTLAMAYLFTGETMQALGYGQTAYCGWWKLRNEVEMANTAFILAETYRKAGLTRHAAHMVERADQHIQKTDYSHKSALFAYQKGLDNLQAADYEQAESWLRMSLAQFEKLNYPYLTGAAHHSLGLAFIHTSKFSDARLHLKTALLNWKQLDNWLEQANVLQALGYLAYKEGDNAWGLGRYYEALEYCKKANPSPALNRLRRDIELSIEDLENNPNELS